MTVGGEQARVAGRAGDVPRALLRSASSAALFLAQAISLTGDQLARVAIASLVYRQTRSAFITALIYAVTYLPWLIGGPLLGGLADRFPRRDGDGELPADQRGAGRR